MQVSHRVFLLPPRRELPPLRHRAIRRCRRLRRLLQPRPGARGGLRLALQPCAPRAASTPSRRLHPYASRRQQQAHAFTLLPVCPGAMVAYSACLESHSGAACTFATGGLPAAVHRGALSGEEMQLIASQHGHTPALPAPESCCYTSSGHACRHGATHTGGGTGPLGQLLPQPRLLEPAPHKLADSTAFGHPGFARTRAA